jgi:hypothetical protein
MLDETALCSFVIVRFQVLTAASMKMAVFWVVAPCSLVEVYRRFELIAQMMEAAWTSETPVNVYQTTQRNNPEDSHLNNRRRENLKYHLDSSLFTMADDIFGTLESLKTHL